MRENIYIRKENEDRWKAITNKSAWVNAYLSKSPPNSIVEAKNLEPEKPIKPRKVEASLCPHAQPWLMCKVASCNVKGRNLGLV